MIQRQTGGANYTFFPQAVLLQIKLLLLQSSLFHFSLHVCLIHAVEVTVMSELAGSEPFECNLLRAIQQVQRDHCL